MDSHAVIRNAERSCVPFTQFLIVASYKTLLHNKIWAWIQSRYRHSHHHQDSSCYPFRVRLTILSPSLLKPWQLLSQSLFQYFYISKMSYTWNHADIAFGNCLSSLSILFWRSGCCMYQSFIPNVFSKTFSCLWEVLHKLVSISPNKIPSNVIEGFVQVSSSLEQPAYGRLDTLQYWPQTF